MEEVPNKQGKGALKTLLIIIGMLAFGGIGFYFGSQNTFKLKCPSEKKEKQVEIIKDNNKVSDEEIAIINEKINFINSEASLNLIGSLYFTGQMSDAEKIDIFLKNVGIEFTSEGLTEEDTAACITGILPAGEILKKYNDFFTGEFNKSSSSVSYRYNEELNRFEYLTCGGYVIDPDHNIINYIDNYSKNENAYVVDYYLGFKDEAGQNLYKIMDGNYVTVLSTSTVGEYKSYVINSENKHLFTHYQITFIKNENGTFAYDSIKIVEQ